jgi:hypothetical protein
MRLTIIIFGLFLFGCKKEDKKVCKITCNELKEFKVLASLHGELPPTTCHDSLSIGKYKFIRSLAGYDSAFCNGRPFGEIDFSSSFLYFTQITAENLANDYDVEYQACLNDASKELYFRVLLNSKFRGGEDTFYPKFPIIVLFPKKYELYKVVDDLCEN